MDKSKQYELDAIISTHHNGGLDYFKTHPNNNNGAFSYNELCWIIDTYYNRNDTPLPTEEDRHKALMQWLKYIPQ
jgi:hypothetical protein